MSRRNPTMALLRITSSIGEQWVEMKTSARNVWLVLLAFIASGCSSLNPREPLETAYYNGGLSRDTLVVLLPGIHDPASDFVKHGIVDVIAEKLPDAGVVTVDAHFGYYRNRSLDARLREDVLLPAREAGVKEVIFLGISLGGLGSLIYRDNYPEDVDAIILVAPYLGEDADLTAFTENPVGEIDVKRPEFVPLWQFLAGNESEEMVTLAYGAEDRYRPQHDWLAAQLPDGQVVTRPGRHLWSVWQELIPEALDRYRDRASRG